MFLKTSQNSQENTYVRVSFLRKVAGLRFVQNISLLKQANFLTEIHKKKSKTQIDKQIQRYEKSSSLLQALNSLFYYPILSSYLMLFCRDIHQFLFLT